MVHRDVKPHNLMVTWDGQVKILDFGLATLTADELPIDGNIEASIRDDSKEDAPSLTSVGSMMGTPDFISPEQSRDARAADIRSDIYSLGCTFYFLLTGRPPFTKGSALERIKAHSEQDAESIENVREEVPPALAEILGRMIAKEPSERFQTPAAVADALAPFVDAHRTKPASGRVPENATMWHRSWWQPTLLQSAALAGFAFVLAGLIYVTTNNGTLEIDSADDSVEIVIRSTKGSKQGQQSLAEMRIVDTLTGSSVKRLPSGQYVLSLKGDKNRYELDKDRFVLLRGDKVIVSVTRKTGPTSPGNSAASAPRRRRVWAGNDDNKGESYDPTTGGVSPDGSYFTGLNWKNGNLAIRDLETGEQRYVTHGSGDLKEGYAYYSKPSPSGRSIAYTWSLGSEGKSQLRVIDVDGNRDNVLYDNPDGAFIYPRAWSTDGNTLVAFLMTDTTAGQIALFSVKDRTYRILKSLDWRWPATTDVSPDGDYIVYDAPLSQGSSDRDVFILPTDGRGPQVQLENPSFDSHPLWTPDGRGIAFVSDRGGSESLWYQRMSAGKPEGSPKLLVENLRFRNRRGRPLGFASNGAYYYVRIADPRLVGDIYSVELNSDGQKVSGIPHRVIQLHQNTNTLPSWSPNGRQLAYTSHRPAGSKIVVRDVGTGDEHELELTNASGERIQFRWWIAPSDYSPAWSPDSQSIVLTGRCEGKQGLHIVDVQSGRVSPLVSKEESVPSFVWSKDGRAIYYLRTVFGNSQAEGTQVVKRDLSTQRETILHELPADANSKNRFIHGLAISPRGQELAMATDHDIGVISINGGGPRLVHKLANDEQVSRKAGIVWTSVGNRLVFGKTKDGEYGSGGDANPRCELWSVSADGGPEVRLDVPADEIHQLCLHPGGRQLTYCRKPRPEEQPGDEIWVIENLLPPAVESQ